MKQVIKEFIDKPQLDNTYDILYREMMRGNIKLSEIYDGMEEIHYNSDMSVDVVIRKLVNNLGFHIVEYISPEISIVLEDNSVLLLLSLMDKLPCYNVEHLGYRKLFLNEGCYNTTQAYNFLFYAIANKIQYSDRLEQGIFHFASGSPFDIVNNILKVIKSCLELFYSQGIFINRDSFIDVFESLKYIITIHNKYCMMFPTYTRMFEDDTNSLLADLLQYCIFK